MTCARQFSAGSRSSSSRHSGRHRRQLAIAEGWGYRTPNALFGQHGSVWDCGNACTEFRGTALNSVQVALLFR
ncbi:MAG: hypothetical protein JWR36_1678 [Glaciihabitans sp.]|nr:hypothetical protein [Glaciihabitans sp.]